MQTWKATGTNTVPTPKEHFNSYLFLCFLLPVFPEMLPIFFSVPTSSLLSVLLSFSVPDLVFVSSFQPVLFSSSFMSSLSFLSFIMPEVISSLWVSFSFGFFCFSSLLGRSAFASVPLLFFSLLQGLSFRFFVPLFIILLLVPLLFSLSALFRISFGFPVSAGASVFYFSVLPALNRKQKLKINSNTWQLNVTLLKKPQTNKSWYPKKSKCYLFIPMAFSFFCFGLSAFLISRFRGWRFPFSISFFPSQDPLHSSITGQLQGTENHC